MLLQRDADTGGAGVLHGVGQAFGHDVVRGRFHPHIRAPPETAVHFHGNVKSLGQGGHGGLQATVAENGRLNSPDEIANIVQRLSYFRVRFLDHVPQMPGIFSVPVFRE